MTLDLSANPIDPKPPTPREIDAAIAEYATAQSKVNAASADLKAASQLADVVKAKVTAMVLAHGQRHAEASTRLKGIRNTATVTVGKRTVVEQTKVDDLKKYLEASDKPELLDCFFTRHVTYSLVQGPSEVLKGLDLGQRIRTKLTALVALCFEIKTNAPSLKVDTPGKD